MRFCNAETRKFFGRIVEVHLIEYTVLIVVGKERPIEFPVLLTLCIEPFQVGLVGEIVGTDLRHHVPDHFTTFWQTFVREHPTEHQLSIVQLVNHREDTRTLQVLMSDDGLYIHAMGLRPLRERLSDE